MDRLTGNQLLGSARRETVMELVELVRQAAAERFGHLCFPSGVMGITDGPEGPPQLVDQRGPDHRRVLVHRGSGCDRRHPPEVTNRRSVRDRIVWPVLRRSGQDICNLRHRPGAVPLETSRPRSKYSGGLPRRPPPRSEVRCRDGLQPLDRLLDARHRPHPIIRAATNRFPARGDRLGSSPIRRPLPSDPRLIAPRTASCWAGSGPLPASRRRTRSASPHPGSSSRPSSRPRHPVPRSRIVGAGAPRSPGGAGRTRLRPSRRPMPPARCGQGRSVVVQFAAPVRSAPVRLWTAQGIPLPSRPSTTVRS